MSDETARPLSAEHSDWHAEGCATCAALDPLLRALNDIDHDDMAERHLIVKLAGGALATARASVPLDVAALADALRAVYDGQVDGGVRLAMLWDDGGVNEGVADPLVDTIAAEYARLTAARLPAAPGAEPEPETLAAINKAITYIENGGQLPGPMALSAALATLRSLRATLDAARASVPLDVERLARAMSADGNDDPAMWDILGEAGHDLWRKRAIRIAAEYTRLAADR